MSQDRHKFVQNREFVNDSLVRPNDESPFFTVWHFLPDRGCFDDHPSCGPTEDPQSKLSLD